MAHEIKIEEVENGLKITDTLDGNIVIKYLTTYALPFIRSTNEAGATYQVVDTVGEIYNLPAEPDEFILYDITGTMYLSSDGTELIENSLNLKPFRRENPYDKVLSLGVVTATEDTVNLPLPISGINSVRIDGNIYSRSIPQTFPFTEVTTGQKILIIEGKLDSTVFYLVEGAEATEAVEPTFTGLFVARIIVDIDGYVVEYPEYGVTLEQARLNGNLIEGDVNFYSKSQYSKITNEPLRNSISLYYEYFASGLGINFSYQVSGSGFVFKNLDEEIDRSINVDFFKGLVGNIEFDKQGDGKAFAQLSDVYDAISYSTDEIKTGGKWIDDKDIYTITQLTADTPPTMETAFPTEVIGTYTVYKYTKP